MNRPSGSRLSRTIAAGVLALTATVTTAAPALASSPTPVAQNSEASTGVDEDLIRFANAITNETVVSLAPSRFADTRAGGETIDGRFEATGRLGAGTELAVGIGGRRGVPADAIGAVINLTAVAPSGLGFVTAYDCATDRPLASSLNYVEAVNVGNEIVVALSAAGAVCLFTSESLHLTVDVAGFIPATSSFVALKPSRLLDTRNNGATIDDVGARGGRTSPGTVITVGVAGRAGVPANVDSVIANLTAVQSGDNGFVTAYPCLPTLPATSSLNYVAGVNRANEVLLDLDGNGNVCLQTSSRLDLILDIVGYVPTGTNLKTVSPARLADTRSTGVTEDGLSARDGAIAANTEYRVRIGGRGGIPVGAQSGILNLTVVNPSEKGFVTMHPCASPRPLAASINYTPGVTGANELVAILDAAGDVCLYSSAAANVILDASGFVANVPTVPALADLSIAKVDDADPVAAGSALTYTLTVSNAGPGGATGVTVMDAMPAEMSVVSTTGCGEDPIGVPTCTLGSIASGASASFTVSVAVEASASGTFTNQAAVMSNVTDPDTSNNVTTESTTVNGVGTINIVKSTTPAGGSGSGFTDTIAAPNAFTLDDAQTKTFAAVPIGSYTVTEIDPSPRKLTGIVCDDGASTNASTTSVATRSATIQVEPGETVTCTFSNNINLAPKITSDGGESTAAVSAAENQTSVTDVQSSDDFDSESSGLTYTVTGGADQALFAIDANGVLEFLSARDFENYSDVGFDGVYDVQVTVADSGPGATLTDVQDIGVTVTDVNEAPSITTPNAVDAAENQTAALDVQSSDPDSEAEGAGLSYVMTGGADQGLLSIGASTGLLTFDAEPNFESMTDANDDGVYEVRVRVSDAAGLTDEQSILVTVTNVNEQPSITSDEGGDTAALSVPENQTAVTDVQSSDPDGEIEGEGEGLSYSLTGGGDRALFSIDFATGVLTFIDPPDMENPTDDGPDGVYDVVVTVTDAGALADAQAIAVTVTGVDEAPVVTTSAGVTAFTGGGAVVVDSALTVTDPESITLASATVTITNLLDAADETLAATASGGIAAGDITFAAGVLTIAPSTAQSLADFQAVLRSVTYGNANSTPATTDRVIAFALDDGALASAAANKTVSVAASPPPAVTAPGR